MLTKTVETTTATPETTAATTKQEATTTAKLQQQLLVKLKQLNKHQQLKRNKMVTMEHIQLKLEYFIPYRSKPWYGRCDIKTN